MRARLLGCLAALLAAPAALAHEFWIEPVAHSIPQGGPLVARLHVGQDYAGSEIPFIPSYFESFTLTTPEGRMPVSGTLGDSPAVLMRAQTPGLAILSYHSTPSFITFDSFEKFESYLRYENNGWAVARHRALGLPETGIREEYIRNAKALVHVGPGPGGGDVATGLPFEVVAQDDPRDAAQSGTMEIALLWEGSPVANQGFNLFRKGGGDPVRLSTDAQGRADLPVSETGRYMVSAVRMIAIDDQDDLHWRSYWASLTFEVTSD